MDEAVKAEIAALAARAAASSVQPAVDDDPSVFAAALT